jgi:hypothetical protein
MGDVQNSDKDQNPREEPSMADEETDTTGEEVAPELSDEEVAAADELGARLHGDGS